jgi:hypothetical protein
MTKLGKATVNAHYPNDHTHTDAYMANVMAGEFDFEVECLSYDEILDNMTLKKT